MLEAAAPPKDLGDFHFLGVPLRTEERPGICLSHEYGTGIAASWKTKSASLAQEARVRGGVSEAGWPGRRVSLQAEQSQGCFAVLDKPPLLWEGLKVKSQSLGVNTSGWSASRRSLVKAAEISFSSLRAKKARFREARACVRGTHHRRRKGSSGTGAQHLAFLLLCVTSAGSHVSVHRSPRGELPVCHVPLPQCLHPGADNALEKRRDSLFMPAGQGITFQI